jgi:hypothetical protein
MPYKPDISNQELLIQYKLIRRVMSVAHEAAATVDSGLHTLEQRPILLAPYFEYTRRKSCIFCVMPG